MVRGKAYFYHRWTEAGKRHEKYVSAGDVPALQAQIKQRKTLEKQLRDLQKQLPKLPSAASREWAATIRIGEELRSFSAGVRQYRKRECFQQLHDYIYGPVQDKVLILYGLRRTGKTTLIRQLFAEMSDDDLSKAAFIQVGPKNTLAEINWDLRRLKEQGFRYVFLDEVTRMEDFIEGAALFSDIFAACGMKIVLSGTDSLGFLFAEDEQLYDRCILLSNHVVGAATVRVVHNGQPKTGAIETETRGGVAGSRPIRPRKFIPPFLRRKDLRTFQICSKKKEPCFQDSFSCSTGLSPTAPYILPRPLRPGRSYSQHIHHRRPAGPARYRQDC